MLAYIIGVVLFALGIGLAVALHEAGHMLTAKAFGMKVRRYFIGFGPKIFSFRRGETEYGLKIIPAGGFCDIAGMTALDEVTPEEAPRAMWRYPVWKRFIVLVSGSVTHFILGFLILYVIAISSGLPNLQDTPQVSGVANCAQSVADIEAHDLAPCAAGAPAPAKQAGLQAGDLIESVGGKATPTWSDVSAAVQKTQVKTQFVIRRDGKDLAVTIDVATVHSVPVAQQNSKTTVSRSSVRRDKVEESIAQNSGRPCCHCRRRHRSPEMCRPAAPPTGLRRFAKFRPGCRLASCRAPRSDGADACRKPQSNRDN